MVRTVASLMGTYFVAFAATNLVVAGSHYPVPERFQVADVAAKGDQLYVAHAARNSTRIAEVELVGLDDDVVVILRDGEGREVYRVDRATSTTIAARDVVFPQLRLHAEIVGEHDRDVLEPTSPPQRTPAGAGEDGLEEEAEEEQTFACESGLSSLADREAALLPRVCLSDASGSATSFLLTSKL